MDIVIETPTLDDMLATQHAHARSIREICGKDYSPEQIKGWSDVQYMAEHFGKAITKDFYRIVRCEGTVEGYIHAGLQEDRKTGEIHGFYLTPKVAGQGIGRQLISLSLEYLKSQNPERIFISATVTAQKFYEHMGFKTVSNLKTHDVRGTPIECYDMEMHL